jgi:DNA-directed RNA polymerase specialized sigma24 family protein
LPPPPLTKRTDDGILYRRPAEIEAALERVLALGRDDILAAVAIQDRGHPDYIPSECLLHLVRKTAHDNNERYFEKLYVALMRRVDRALPRDEHRIGEQVGVDLTRNQIRNQVRGRFEELLIHDRGNGDERLDLYEARFNFSLARLRATAREKAWREAGRQKPLERDDETGEMSLEVEIAAGSLVLPDAEKWNDPIYRSRLDAAIRSLPPEQSRIITMLKIGIPIDSSDPNVVTISKLQNCVEKTVRNRAKKAIAALQSALGLEHES